MNFLKNPIDDKIISDSNRKHNRLPIYKFDEQNMTKIIEKNWLNTFEINNFHLNDRLRLNMNNNNDVSQKSNDLTLKQQIDIISQITQKPIEDIRVSLNINIIKTMNLKYLSFRIS
jgi:hypothetical protein